MVIATMLQIVIAVINDIRNGGSSGSSSSGNGGGSGDVSSSTTVQNYLKLE